MQFPSESGSGLVWYMTVAKPRTGLILDMVEREVWQPKSLKTYPGGASRTCVFTWLLSSKKQLLPTKEDKIQGFSEGSFLPPCARV